MPIKWRSLAATLNPQPLAFAVIRRLLDWIDRCDQASKRNLPAPLFRAEDGGPIFPAEGSEDEYWWLTDVKRTDEKKDEDKADEDGPPDSESEAQDDGEDPKAADALTTDSDPDSDRGESLSQAVVLPVRYDSSQLCAPWRAWADKADPQRKQCSVSSVVLLRLSFSLFIALSLLVSLPLMLSRSHTHVFCNMSHVLCIARAHTHEDLARPAPSRSMWRILDLSMARDPGGWMP